MKQIKKTKYIAIFLCVAIMMSSVAFATIGYGDSGSAVTAIQQKFNKLGYSITTDGNFGPITRDTVKDFQFRRGLEIDGYVGPITSAELDKAIGERWTIMWITTIPSKTSYGYNATTGSGVKAIQIMLNTMGYNLVVDGQYGSASKVVVKEFQGIKKLKADGYAGPTTRAAIEKAWKAGWEKGDDAEPPVPEPSVPEPPKPTTGVLQVGSSGSAVSALQSNLNTLGYSLGVDGQFGSKTREAVIDFQSQNGLVADGYVGPITSGKIYEKVAVIKSYEFGVYQTVKDNVPIWSGPTSKTTKAKIVEKAGTKLRIDKVFYNSYHNIWGKTDQNTYIFMDNVKRYKYIFVWTDVKYARVTCITVNDNVSVWQGPSSYSARFTELNSKGTRVDIVATGFNEFNKEWGKTAQGKYIWMENLQKETVTTSRILKYGFSGEDVKQLQHSLNELGYSLIEDGKFGSKTKSSVIDFQRRKSLQIDGCVGPLTKEKINELVSTIRSYEIGVYVTVKNRVSIWSSSSSATTRVKYLEEEGLKLRVDEVFFNSDFEIWGKTDQNTYVEMKDIKRFAYKFVWKDVKKDGAIYETLKEDILIWNGPSSYSNQYSILTKKGDRVEIVEIGTNEFDNEWGKTVGGHYVWMSNLKKAVKQKDLEDYAEYKVYLTNEDGVSIWSNATSKAYLSEEVDVIAKENTEVAITQIIENLYGNPWGKTKAGKYIYMKNLHLPGTDPLINAPPNIPGSNSLSGVRTLIGNKVIYETIRPGVAVYLDSIGLRIVKRISEQGRKIVVIEDLIIPDYYSEKYLKTQEGYYINKADIRKANNPGAVVLLDPENTYYKTNNENVPVWNEPTSDSKQVDIIKNKETPIKIISLTVNKYGHLWGRMDNGSFIYMNNLDTSICVEVNGERVEFDTAPIVLDSERILIPAAELIRILGGTIEWDEETGCIIIQNGLETTVIEVEMGILYNDFTANIESNTSTRLKIDIRMINDRVYLLPSTINQMIDAKSEWDQKSRTLRFTGFENLNDKQIRDYETDLSYTYDELMSVLNRNVSLKEDWLVFATQIGAFSNEIFKDAVESAILSRAFMPSVSTIHDMPNLLSDYDNKVYQEVIEDLLHRTAYNQNENKIQPEKYITDSVGTMVDIISEDQKELRLDQLLVKVENLKKNNKDIDPSVLANTELLFNCIEGLNTVGKLSVAFNEDLENLLADYTTEVRYIDFWIEYIEQTGSLNERDMKTINLLKAIRFKYTTKYASFFDFDDGLLGLAYDETLVYGRTVGLKYISNALLSLSDGGKGVAKLFGFAGKFVSAANGVMLVLDGYDLLMDITGKKNRSLNYQDAKVIGPVMMSFFTDFSSNLSTANDIKERSVIRTLSDDEWNDLVIRFELLKGATLEMYKYFSEFSDDKLEKVYLEKQLENFRDIYMKGSPVLNGESVFYILR